MMESTALYVLLVASATLTLASDFQLPDLKNSTELCGVERANCDPKKSSTYAVRNYTLRNCMCDAACAMYGDCCVDSPHFEAPQQRSAVTQFSCMDHEELGSYYERQACPASWTDVAIRRKCEMSARANTKDLLLMTPVTDHRNNVTYGNVFCAQCNNRTLDSLEMWKIGFRCPPDSPHVYNATDDRIFERINFDKETGYWQLTEVNRSISCSFQLVLPPHSKTRLVACEDDMTKTCPPKWMHEPQQQGQTPLNVTPSSSSLSSTAQSRESIRVSCESYTMVVFPDPSRNGYQSYRNAHCAICNGINVEELNCDNSAWNRFKGGWTSSEAPSLTMLFDFGSIMTQSEKYCGPGRVYDGLLKMCRDDIDVNFASLVIRQQPGCSSAQTVETNFSFVDDNYDNVYVPHDNHTYEMGQYMYHVENQSVTVCQSTSASKDPIYPIHFHVISILGIGVSVICLIVHLCSFVLLKDMRNLAGKCLASLCLALLVAYSSFALTNALEDTACLVNAALAYYSFLAAFSWMLIISFDVWRSLKIATKQFRVTYGQQWCRFLSYSACGWLVPAIFVVVALLVDQHPAGISRRFQPNFGRKACWFNNGEALLVFFVLPVFVTLVCNVSFFVFSAIMIYSAPSMARYSASPVTERDFRLYARLSVLMGLTWITGLIAGVARNNVVWILFILSNAFMGLFIFVAFTWRTSVLRGLQNLKDGNSSNRPASRRSMNGNNNAGSKSQQPARATIEEDRNRP